MHSSSDHRLAPWAVALLMVSVAHGQVRVLKSPKDHRIPPASDDFSAKCSATMGCRLYDLLANFSHQHMIYGVAGAPWEEIQFSSCCHYRVIRIISAEDSYLIGVGFTKNGRTHSTLTWRLGEFTKHNELDYIFRTPVYLVARLEPSNESPSSVAVSVDVSVQLETERLHMFKQLNTKDKPSENIFGPFHLHDKPNGTVSLVAKHPDNSAFLFLNSYLLFCAAPVDVAGNPNHEAICYPIFGQGTFVRCLCDTSGTIQIRFLPILVLCSLLWLLAFIVSSKARVLMEFPSFPETQHLLIMCQAKNARYMYDVIFRVGCPSPSFDMNNTFIDIELLGADMEIIGTPIRFCAAKLPDIICGELRCQMSRLTLLNRIDAIRVYHSGGGGPDQVIYLYDFFLRDSIIKQIVQAVHINRHITSEPALITIPQSNTFPVTSSGPLSQQINAAAFSAVSNPEVPVLPMQKLNRLECCIIFHLAVLYAGALLLALYLTPNSPEIRKILLIEHLASVLPLWPADNMLGAVLVATVALLATFALIYSLVYLYRNVIKWHYFKQKHIQGRHQSLWSNLRSGSMVLAIAFALAFTFYMLLRSSQLTIRQCSFWWSSYFICLLKIGLFWHFNPFVDKDRQPPI